MSETRYTRLGLCTVTPFPHADSHVTLTFAVSCVSVDLKGDTPNDHSSKIPAKID